MKRQSERTIYRNVDDLFKKFKLIELIDDEHYLKKITATKYIKPYRLSLSGIFYIIMNSYDITYDDLILYLLKNYQENILFTLFLYPFIKKQTLLENDWDTPFFSIVSSYLKDISKTIITYVKSIKSMSTSTDGYYNIHLLDWPNSSTKIDIPISHYSNLRYFLKKTLDWYWIDIAKIIPKVNENSIEIIDKYNPENKYNIHIIKDEKKAILRQYGKWLWEFSVIDNGSFLTMEAKTDRKSEDIINVPFVESCKRHLLNFLTSLKTNVIPSSSYTNQSFETLTKDEKYQKALKYLEKELKFNQSS